MIEVAILDSILSRDEERCKILPQSIDLCNAESQIHIAKDTMTTMNSYLCFRNVVRDVLKRQMKKGQVKSLLKHANLKYKNINYGQQN